MTLAGGGVLREADDKAPAASGAAGASYANLPTILAQAALQPAPTGAR
jgi:hypothetical protein